MAEPLAVGATAAILGVDAAWTEREPSGVALVSGSEGRWRCRALAPSYDAFIRLADGQGVDWSARHFRGSAPDVTALLAAASRLLADESTIRLVTVDIPVATVPILTRRVADQEISRHFGGRWCAAHTPSPARPGPVGVRIRDGFAAAGFPLATAGAGLTSGRHLVEVYPHPALLTLLAVTRRVPYKVGKQTRYWPDDTPAARMEKILEQFAGILAGLRREISDIPLELPAPSDRPAAALKRYEDALDALVCAWVGTRCLRGGVASYGDATAAIWVP